MTAKDLLQRFPDRFKVVRYEDLTMNVDQFSKELWDFTGIPSEKKYEQKNKKKASQIPYNWLKKMNTSKVKRRNSYLTFYLFSVNNFQIHNVQEKCRGAMRVWGYKLGEGDPMEINGKDLVLPYSMN